MPSSGCKTSGSEEHTSELQSHDNLVCRLLLEKKNDLGLTHPNAGSPPQAFVRFPVTSRGGWRVSGGGWGLGATNGRAHCDGVLFFFLMIRPPPSFPPFPYPALSR